MAVGNIVILDVNTIIAAGRTDLCLLARARIFDPCWTRHAAWMLGYPLPWLGPANPSNDTRHGSSSVSQATRVGIRD